MEFKTGTDDRLILVLEPRLDAQTVSVCWDGVTRQIQSHQTKLIEIDAGQVEYCDGSGLALVFHIEQIAHKLGGQVHISNASETVSKLLEVFRPAHPEETFHGLSLRRRIVEDVGKAAWRVWLDLHTLVSFTGEVSYKLGHVMMRPRLLRWRDTFFVAEKSGADGVGITVLLGLLIGLILAFQSAVAMQQFGAEVYVADLVVLSLFRELGPLITAFVLASRSGSAFAAELGTMKVNEEVDAMVTMGLDPVSFLVLPRVVASVVVLPLLTILHNLAGLIGCGLVMALLGYPVVTFVSRLQFASGFADLFGGLVKTLVFGVLIAGIGCLRGLQVRNSPSAVGDAATRAVVSSIVAIIAVDGIFAVLYYFLGW